MGPKLQIQQVLEGFIEKLTRIAMILLFLSPKWYSIDSKFLKIPRNFRNHQNTLKYPFYKASKLHFPWNQTKSHKFTLKNHKKRKNYKNTHEIACDSSVPEPFSPTIIFWSPLSLQGIPLACRREDNLENILSIFLFFSKKRKNSSKLPSKWKEEKKTVDGKIHKTPARSL